MNKINVSVSYGYGEDNRYSMPWIPTNVQLALYKYDVFMQSREQIYLHLLENDIKVRVVHLPLDTLKTPFNKIVDMMNEVFDRTGCPLFVIHPNRGIHEFVRNYNVAMQRPLLSIETFGWKSNKSLRSPLEIIDYVRQFRNGLTMTLDTTHIEELWFDYRIMSHLLKYTRVIHLSNRAKGVGQHIPFNDSRGSLNLVGFVNDLKGRYKWKGELVLEYMEDYRHKILKNAKYVESLLAKYNKWE